MARAMSLNNFWISKTNTGKMLFFKLSLILLLSSCRSIGSWYGENPAPVDQIQLNTFEESSYRAKRVRFNSMTYDLIILDPQKNQIEIHRSPDSKGLSFQKLLNNESTESKLIFATNGGMYKEDRSPLGYYAENGKCTVPLNLRDGYGNFYLKPNGVFLLNEQIPQILETEEFFRYLQNGNPIPDLATQSGPLLLYNNEIHKTFTIGSSNKYIRNGVGIIHRDSGDLIVFAISNKPVNFFDFASFFKDFLQCSNALYLDGHISEMYLPNLNRNQKGRSYGTVIYMSEP